MNVSIRGRNVDIPDAARRSVRAKVGRLARLLDGDGADVEVQLSAEGRRRAGQGPITCELAVHGPGSGPLRSKAVADDLATAVDQAVEKLDHQLARAKRRTSRPRRGRAAPPVAARDGDTAAGDAARRPRIVRTTQPAGKPMTADDAVLELEQAATAVLLFTNAETGRAAAVYRDADGALVVVDSE